MPSELSCWEIYNKEMSQLNHGHALWEPAPLSYFERIQPGDVGYIRTGCFQLLFSAGCPLGERQPGVDVPSTFKQLEVGPMINRQPRPPGYLSTNTVRTTRIRLTPPVPLLSASQPSASPPSASSPSASQPSASQPSTSQPLTSRPSASQPSASQPSASQPPASPVPRVRPVTSASSSTSDVCSKTLESISFRLTRGQGAALVTRCFTYREDIQRAGTFERYTKEHYASWVTFARETGHGNDINPVLVTGVDRTRDFAMMSYSGGGNDLMSEFIAPVSGAASASAWGTWNTTGFVHTNCGPQLCCPPSPTTNLTSSGNNNTETISDWYNQCVFVRYYTVRRKLGVPRVIKAGAGPHDLGSGGREDGEESPEVGARSDSGSDVVSSPSDYDGENDKSSVTSIESESDIFIHNTTPDGKDDFDVIADYVFQNSDAESVLIHHRDIARLREGSTDLSTQILERQPPITVDENGVGTIWGEAEPSADNDPLYITPSTSPFIPSESENEGTDGMELLEPRPPSQLTNPSLGVLSCEREATTGDGDSIFKSIAPPHDDPTVGRSTLACVSEEGEEEMVVSLPSRPSAKKNEMGQSVALSIPSDATASSSVLGPERSLFDTPPSPAIHPYSQLAPGETHRRETEYWRNRSRLIRAATTARSSEHSTSSISTDANGLCTTSAATSEEQEKKNVVVTEEPAKIKTKMSFKPVTREDTNLTSATENRCVRKRPEQFPARESGSTSHSTPSLRPASLSSPALRPDSQAILDVVHTPKVVSPTSNIPVPPQRTRSISLKPQPLQIGGLSTLPPRRSSKEATRESNNASKPNLTPTQTRNTIPQRDRFELVEPPSPSKRLETTRGSAGTSHPLTPPSSLIRLRSPASQHDPTTPSTGDKVRRTSLDLPNTRRTPVEGRLSALRAPPQLSSPPSKIRPRVVTPNPPSRTTSLTPPARGDDIHDRYLNPSTAFPPPSVPANLSNTGNSNLNTNPEHRDLLRQATSILCKELLSPPENDTTALGVIELEQIELRLRELVKLERIWGKSGANADAVSDTSGSAITGFSGLVAGGDSTLGEDRERRLFSEALRDGYVLCQLMNKVRPGSITHVNVGEDGATSNITKFLVKCYSMSELTLGGIFAPKDLIEGSFESLAYVSRTIIALFGVSEKSPPRSPLRPEPSYDGDCQIPPSSMMTSLRRVDLSPSPTPPRDLHVHRSRSLANEMKQNHPRLMPRGSVLGRDVSPDNQTVPPTSKAIIPHRGSPGRNPSPFGRSSLDNEGRPVLDGPVSFPRTVSGSGGQSKQNNPTSNLAAVAEVDEPQAAEKPKLVHGRFQKEIGGSGSREKPRPISNEGSGQNPRRSRPESMVNLGVATNTAGMSKHLKPSALGDDVVGLNLIVREEGKQVVQVRLGCRIGWGQFGAVYQGQNLNTGQMVAARRINLTGLMEEEISQLVKEVDIVKSLSHPSIVKYEGVVRDDDILSIVLEYVGGSSLGQTLKLGKLNERLVAEYVDKIVEGLHYLHQNGIVHCDLKAANILTTEDGDVKLSDFGVSLNFREMKRQIKAVAGIPDWRAPVANWTAPEVTEPKRASPKSDIWSLGCTVIELLTGKPLNVMTFMLCLTERKLPIPETVSPLLDDFLRQCLQRDPAKRPDAGTLCQHEWLRKNRGLPKELRPHSRASLVDRVDYTMSSISRPLYPNSDSADFEALIHDEVPRRVSPRVYVPPPTPIRPTSQDNHGPAVHKHSFVTTTSSEPATCRVCFTPTGRGAMHCDHCGLIAHSKCAYRAPPKCDRRAQLLSYGRSAERGPSLLESPGWTTISPHTEVVPTPPYLAYDRRPTPSPTTPTFHLPTAFVDLATFKRSRSPLSLKPTTRLTPSVNPISTPRERLSSLHPRKRKEKDVAELLSSNTRRNVDTRSETIAPGDNDT